MSRVKMTGLAVGLLVLGMGWEGVYGAGILVPTDTSLPPLAMKYLRVEATIENQAATTHVTQEFANTTSRPLECTYIFPLPKGASVRSFAMYIGGKRVEGELLEKEKARTVYEEIVRRTKDPGLLEYMDGGLLRMRVFPVPAQGTQKVEVEYTELAGMDAGLGEYVFLLRTGQKSSQTLEDFTVSVRIKSEAGIKSVYSPSHEVGVTKVNEHEAVAGMEKKGAMLDEDFRLFWAVNDKEFGVNLMTYRPDPTKPGMFLLLVSPRTEVEKSGRVARDVVLVFDTSGSMKGPKLEQAKAAMKYCIRGVGTEDRFAMVQFATTAQSYAEGWTAGTEEGKKKACEWVDGQEAGGATNIWGALGLALGLPTDEKRPVTILFVTDGQPTAEVTDVKQLVQLVKEKNSRGERIFTFGVGDDVDTHLLDLIAEATGGLPEYVRPNEQIDTKVTRLFGKMTNPVLTGLKIEAPGVKLAEMYPGQLPDLFAGSQVVIAGSYEKDGASAIRLSGQVGGKTREFVYEGTFPAKSEERAFIGAIYANRKIGYLLDQIRLHGENPELKSEVIRLSLMYGIQTPYTSYLVLESKEQYAMYGVEVQRGMTGGAADAPAAKAEAGRRQAAGERVESEMKMGGAATATTPGTAPVDKTRAGMKGDAETLKKETTGAKAVEVAGQVQKMRQTETGGGMQQVQQRGGRQLTNYRGVWVDEKFQGTEKLTKVKWGSEAYFRLAREHKDLREILSLGERVVVVTAKNQAVVVDVDEGLDKLDDEQAKGLFTDM